MIEVFAVARLDGELAVALPASWAAGYDRAEVVFDHSDMFGWQADLVSPAGDRIVGFPWSDHVDKMLRGEVPSELPDPALPDGVWVDMDEGWWAVIRVVGDEVFIAETDGDRLSDLRGDPTVSPGEPGHVDVSGVPVGWSRVPRAAWDAAWAAARASCAEGRPAPTRPPGAADG